MDKISIIIVSFNTKAITDKCLLSVQKSKVKGQIEIIVVDNASTDGTVEMIKTKYPQVKLIASKTNTGFTGGNNLGMQVAKGDYFLLLNSDAFLKPDTLENCLEFMQTNPTCDVLGCKLTFEDGRLQPSAGYLPNPVNTTLWVWGIDTWPVLKNTLPTVHPKNPSFFKNSKTVGWVTGAFMFLKREVYVKTGGFDEKYFMYTEEIDWCKRIQQKGFNVYYASEFSIIHLLAASSGFKQPYIKEMQGMKYYFKKHYQWLSPFMNLVIKIGNIARVVAFEIDGNKERANIYREILKDI